MFELKTILLFSASLKLFLGILLLVYGLMSVSFKPTIYVATGSLISGLGLLVHSFYPYPIEVINLLFLNLTVIIGDGMIVVGLWALQKKKINKFFLLSILIISLFQTFFFTEIWRHDGIRVATNSIIYASIGAYAIYEFTNLLKTRLRALFYTIAFILYTHCAILLVRAIFSVSNAQIDLMAPSTIGLSMHLYIVLGQTSVIFCYTIIVNHLLREELGVLMEKQRKLQVYKEELSSMIVHDLKNPLNALINAPSVFEGKKLNQFVEQLSVQMLTLVLNILDINKSEEGKLTLLETKFNIREAVIQNLKQLKMLYEDKNLTLDIEIAEDCKALADKDLFNRVIINLLTNAIKFSPNNDKISIKSTRENGFVKISVSDNGPGIAPENHEIIFNKFEQIIAKSSGTIRSSGLGLPFCKIAVEAHGGEIGVESELGKGSTFWVTFPGAAGMDEERTNAESLIINKLEFNFTPSEEKIVAACANSLKRVEIFELTTIKNEINKLKSSDSQNVKQWGEQVLQAVFAGNHYLYNSLIQDALNGNS